MSKNKKKWYNRTLRFFSANMTKTCTIRRLIKEIKLLAGNLGTEFEMLWTIYYLLYGSEIFNDFVYTRSNRSTKEI